MFALNFCIDIVLQTLLANVPCFLLPKYTHTHTLTHTNTPTHTLFQSTWKKAPQRKMEMYTHTHPHIHINTHTHTHPYTHTHSHTHSHTAKKDGWKICSSFFKHKHWRCLVWCSFTEEWLWGERRNEGTNEGTKEQTNGRKMIVIQSLANCFDELRTSSFSPGRFFQQTFQRFKEGAGFKILFSKHFNV